MTTINIYGFGTSDTISTATFDRGTGSCRACGLTCTTYIKNSGFFALPTIRSAGLSCPHCEALGFTFAADAPQQDVRSAT